MMHDSISDSHPNGDLSSRSGGWVSLGTHSGEIYFRAFSIVAYFTAFSHASIGMEKIATKVLLCSILRQLLFYLSSYILIFVRFNGHLNTIIETDHCA